MKKLSVWISFVLFIILEEAIFSLFVFEHLKVSFFCTIAFSFVFGTVFFLITNFCSGKVNKIFTYFLLSLMTFLYMAHFVYNQIYLSVISIYSIFHGGGQILQFVNQIIDVVLGNWYVIVLLALPLILWIILDIKKCLSYEKIPWLQKLLLLLIAALVQVGTILSFLLFPQNSIYSNKHLYFDLHAPLLTVEKMGVLTMMRLDVVRFVTGFEESLEVGEVSSLPSDTKSEENKKVEYNALEIDFDKLIEEENDEVIRDMHTYFSKQEASNKNEYTGMFQGKNLIVFVAEAFSQLAIDKELTPTLYKLYEQGFQFDNFYTPLFPVSTADGEYMTDTSLIPKEGVWSLAKLKGNYMPYSYANVFKNLGYTNHAYHNNTATYYKRDVYLKAMGYDSFKACGRGLDINCKIWPQSDVEMINATVSDYLQDEHFLAYYMTVSGHLEYTRNGNMMVTKNWNLVKDLNYSDKAKSYLAANIELDRAVAKLIEELEKAGRLEDTVIAISGDHYPYGLTLDEVNELSSYERDADFEIHHMPFLVWNSEMEDSVKVEKYGSSLDVLPTILNLFGVEYDSRVLMGRDLLSDSPGLVIFSNRSFICPKGKYNSIQKVFTSFDGSSVDEEYISQLQAIVYNKYKYSKLVLEKDYYRKLFLNS